MAIEKSLLVSDITWLKFNEWLEERVKERGFRITDENNSYAIGAREFRNGARLALNFLAEHAEIEL